MAAFDNALSRLRAAQDEADRLKAMRVKALVELRMEEARLRAENEKTRSVLSKCSLSTPPRLVSAA